MSNKESNIIICRATTNDIEDIVKLRLEFIEEIKPRYKEYKYNGGVGYQRKKERKKLLRLRIWPEKIIYY